MAKLTNTAKTLIQRKNLAYFATIMKDGAPQVSAVWIDCDSRHVLVNTVTGRVKEKNVRRDPRVALSITDNEDPYKQVMVRGRVVGYIVEDAWEHINKLSHKYTGRDYPKIPNETRIILKIAPENITHRHRSPTGRTGKPN